MIIHGNFSDFQYSKSSFGLNFCTDDIVEDNLAEQALQ
jgi:hypothetical protein